jgi:hypothetical protein
MAQREDRPLDDQPARAIARRRRAVEGSVEPYAGPMDEDPDLPLPEDVERFGDVTMTCPQCGATLYDDVALCYNCGRAVGPGTERKGAPLWAVLVAVAVVLGIVLVYVL